MKHCEQALKLMNIKTIKSEEDAILVAKEELLKTGQTGDPEVLHIWKFGPKDTSIKKEGWMVIFKSNLPKGFEPEVRVQLYPSLSQVHIPDLI
jgi:hypothetical protein